MDGVCQLSLKQFQNSDPFSPFFFCVSRCRRLVKREGGGGRQYTLRRYPCFFFSG
ncbi:Uncharacterized protein APZ42_016965 [Daphnia magna]|uniref:Uncharacterized protein n=1 Tax=Daphnia magna TaxID=35525 RepID=A0A165A9E1_9CRUS|nr:Uncharacterized protein APZ42_016965 [Daphnia magna]